MHGGKSLRGADHPNFRHGRCSKLLRQASARLGGLLRRPIKVEVLLFPRPLNELADQVGRQPLRGLIVPPQTQTIGERMRALRAARRMLAEELAALRAEAENGP
jgi:hypothetical protein